MNGAEVVAEVGLTARMVVGQPLFLAGSPSLLFRPGNWAPGGSVRTPEKFL